MDLVDQEVDLQIEFQLREDKQKKIDRIKDFWIKKKQRAMMIELGLLYR